MKRKSKAKPTKRKVSKAARALDRLKAELTAAIFDLHRRVQRLEDGHSGDPAAHAALAPEQPASDAGEVAGEPTTEQA